MTESMVQFQIQRRKQLQHGDKPATAVQTKGIGSRNNDDHLNLNVTIDGKLRPWCSPTPNLL